MEGGVPHPIASPPVSQTTSPTMDVAHTVNTHHQRAAGEGQGSMGGGAPLPTSGPQGAKVAPRKERPLSIFSGPLGRAGPISLNRAVQNMVVTSMTAGQQPSRRFTVHDFLEEELMPAKVKGQMYVGSLCMYVQVCV